MPMTWNAEADAKMMVALVNVCGVQVNEKQYTAIAAAMGSECTAKAIKHRLGKLRKLAPGHAGDADGEPQTKKAKTTKGDGGSKKSAKAAGKQTEVEDDEGASTIGPVIGKKRGRQTQKNNDEAVAAAPSIPKKRGRPAKQSGTDESTVRVKREQVDDGDGIAVGEDIGEGLRSMSEPSSSDDDG